jgi:hypothetical protein
MKQPIKKRNNNGTFLIGNQESNGRPKGSKNKTTAELQRSITFFLCDRMDEIAQIWDDLEPKDKATLFIHLSKLVIPKTIKEEKQEPPVFNFEGITTYEIKQLLGEDDKPL